MPVKEDNLKSGQTGTKMKEHFDSITALRKKKG